MPNVEDNIQEGRVRDPYGIDDKWQNDDGMKLEMLQMLIDFSTGHTQMGL